MMADQLDMEQAGKLLHLLSTSDSVRASFQNDPVGTIRQHTGADISSKGDCCKVTSLASKEAIAAARASLFERLTTAMAQNVHELDAG
jgi:putative modified peptide